MKRCGKCTACGRTLRTAIEPFKGDSTRCAPPKPGERMDGNMTCIKMLSGPDWCRDFRVGHWIVQDGRKVCTTCANEQQATGATTT